MFETRDYRASLIVSLFLSVSVHLVFLLLVRVEIDLEERDLWDSIIGIRKIFFVFPGGRMPVTREKMVVLKIEEVDGALEETPPRPREEVKTEEHAVEAEPAITEEETLPGIRRPFYPDSLDLLLTFPWIAPFEEERPGPRRMVGLERALRRLWADEIERREADELALDSKYGKFGVSSRGILLGPIVIPIPLAPYTTGERRMEERARSEIEAQSLRKSMSDDDIQQQRDRIIEWKKRREGGE